MRPWCWFVYRWRRAYWPLANVHSDPLLGVAGGVQHHQQGRMDNVGTT